MSIDIATNSHSEADYIVTYRAVNKENGDERHWMALGQSETSARQIIADMVALHRNVEPFDEFHYVLTLSKNNVVIHTETDAQ